jgi:prepilin-type N-terminal cleavage/methylation domain-containing protein/prepilin-type processing-associated H-X9-DG protein
MRSRTRRAFSLIELLVVIGIIALLLMILLPIISRVRESARQAACASNMGQIAAALLGYTGANRGQVPAPSRSDMILPDDWLHWQSPPYGKRNLQNSALAPYLGLRSGQTPTFLRCPSDPLTQDTHKPGGYPYSYSMNTGLWRGIQFGQGRLPITKVKRPAEKALFYDENDPNDGAYWYAFDDSLTSRHFGQGNIAFFDGHVEAEPPEFARNQKYNDPTY